MNFNLQNLNFFNLVLMMSSFANAGLLTRRIIGGHRTQASKFPHEVVVILESNWVPRRYEYQNYFKGSACGGSVIAKDAVLIAAHCVPIREPKFYSITGKIDDMRNINHPNFPKLTATQIITHEEYNLETFNSDIAIIKVQSNHELPPILLDLEKKSEGTWLNIAGWGKDKSGQHLDYMKELDIIIESKDFCSQFIRIYKPNKEICVTGIQKGNMFYYGDSGSPVVSNSNKLVGVVSYIEKPYFKGIGVIQSVSYFSNWIKRYAPNAKFSQQDYNQDSDNEITPNTQERKTNPYYQPQSQEKKYHQHKNNYPNSNQYQHKWFNHQGQQQDQRYNPQQHQGKQRYYPQQHQGNKIKSPQQYQSNQKYYPQQGYQGYQNQKNPQKVYQKNQKSHQGYQRYPNQQSPDQGYQYTQLGYSQNQKPNQGSYTRFSSPYAVYSYKF